MHAQTTLEHILLIAGGAALIAITAALLIPSGSNVYEIIRSKGGEELFPKENPADLSATITSFTYATKKDEKHILSFRICNNGPGDVNYIALITDSLSSIREPFSYKGFLRNGDCVDKQFMWVPLESGIHTVKVVVTGNREDHHIANNTTFIMIPVEKKSSEINFNTVRTNTTNPKTIFFENIPDLNVRFISLPHEAEVNAPSNISVVVCNNGNKTADYNIVIFGDGDFSPVFFLGVSKPKKCTTHMFLWTPRSKGENKVTVQLRNILNGDELLSDSNPANNSASVEIHVKEHQKISLTITEYPNIAFKELSYVITARVCGSGTYNILLSDIRSASITPASVQFSVSKSCTDHHFVWIPQEPGTHTITVKIGDLEKRLSIDVKDLKGAVVQRKPNNKPKNEANNKDWLGDCFCNAKSVEELRRCEIEWEKKQQLEMRALERCADDLFRNREKYEAIARQVNDPLACVCDGAILEYYKEEILKEEQKEEEKEKNKLLNKNETNKEESEKPSLSDVIELNKEMKRKIIFIDELLQMIREGKIPSDTLNVWGSGNARPTWMQKLGRSPLSRARTPEEKLEVMRGIMGWSKRGFYSRVGIGKIHGRKVIVIGRSTLQHFSGQITTPRY